MSYGKDLANEIREAGGNEEDAQEAELFWDGFYRGRDRDEKDDDNN